MRKYAAFLILSAGLCFVFQARADEANDKVIKDVMKTCNSAPKGTDSICKKAVEGKASSEELAKLVACYKKLTTTTPPKGDLDDWKDKTAKLYDAAKKLEADPTATADFKAAVDCKACHSLHKPK
jgi:hypothetical protein